jgi:recombinase
VAKAVTALVDDLLVDRSPATGTGWLDRAGVLLAAADEPMQPWRKRATAILTRRVKQGVAEWYVLETLEKSWDGFMKQTKQGHNVGRPPYGYVADKIPHPVPARREQGKVKTRLVPDPMRANVVRMIYDLYLNTGMGLDLVRDRLNADPVVYPPPVPPDPRRSLVAWSSSSIRDILHNPKYTPATWSGTGEPARAAATGPTPKASGCGRPSRCTSRWSAWPSSRPYKAKPPPTKDRAAPDPASNKGRSGPSTSTEAGAVRDLWAADDRQIETTVADLTRRLHRQLLNLEDDNLSGAARYQIADRIGQLEADHRHPPGHGRPTPSATTRSTSSSATTRSTAASTSKSHSPTQTRAVRRMTVCAPGRSRNRSASRPGPACRSRRAG